MFEHPANFRPMQQMQQTPRSFLARNRILIPLLSLVLGLSAFGTWKYLGGHAEPNALPAGAIPIASEYVATYTKAVSDFKDGQKKMNDANALVKRIIELSLGRVAIPIEKFDDYRLDEARQALLPITDQEKEKIKKQKELSERFQREAALIQ